MSQDIKKIITFSKVKLSLKNSLKLIISIPILCSILGVLYSFNQAPSYESKSIITLATMNFEPYQDVNSVVDKLSAFGEDSFSIKEIAKGYFESTGVGKTFEESNKNLQKLHTQLETDSDSIYNRMYAKTERDLDYLLKKDKLFLDFIKILENMEDQSKNIEDQEYNFVKQIHLHRIQSIDIKKNIKEVLLSDVSYKNITFTPPITEKSGNKVAFSFFFSLLMGLLISTSIVLIKDFLITSEDN